MKPIRIKVNMTMSLAGTIGLLAFFSIQGQLIPGNHLVLGVSIGSLFFTLADYKVFCEEANITSNIMFFLKWIPEDTLKFIGLTAVIGLTVWKIADVIPSKIIDFITIICFSLYLLTMGLREANREDINK